MSWVGALWHRPAISIFCAYVAQGLVPILRPGDIVILDNLASHKVAGVRAMIEATGASLRYLPPYSPTSTRSSSSSPSSKRACARLPHEPSARCSPPSPTPSQPSPQPSAPTISPTQAIATNHESALGHTKIESTMRYLGIEVDDALAIAEQVDV